MYRIMNVIDGVEYILHDQRDRNLTVLEPRLCLTLNKTGTLDFRIPEEHKYYSTIKKLKSDIQVIEDGKLIYEGRIIVDELDFYNTRSITCEGSLAFFLDSVQRPFKVSGKSPREFLAQMISSHNEQVEARKRFTLGQVTVVDTDGRVECENQSISRTWDILTSYLLDAVGGYLWVSYQDGKKVLNYTWDYGGYNEQEIRFGINLLDLSRYQDATKIFTRVIPTGADIEYKDELGETQKKVVDITSVNRGIDYMNADQATIDEYGIITTALNWPMITDPEKLKMKAAAYLKESIQIPETLKISAIDLNYAGVNIQRFKLGYYTKVISRQHHLEKELL
ncbi:MAG: phage tail spike protein, partial [Clostridium sp.]